MRDADMLSTALQNLIFREARLLDAWQLDDWLALYSQDATYWLPIDERADPGTATSLVYETRQILEMRVEQLMRESRLSQTPRSEIMRVVSNVEIDAAGLSAEFCLLALEVRSGDWRQRGLGQKRTFAGRCRMEFREEAEGLRIVRKQIVLLDRRQPIEGLSFIL
jgi:3-phenylpropionate/cinnamic acid dioxygenase small subunit